MKYNGVIEKKLRVIEEKLNDIKEWDIDSFDKLAKSSLLQNAVERALQVAVEAMIDVSERILALENISPQSTSAGNIKKLQDMNMLTELEEYQDMVRFRNFIVHRYENIDLEIVYGILTTKLQLFEQFIKDIRNT